MARCTSTVGRTDQQTTDSFDSPALCCTLSFWPIYLQEKLPVVAVPLCSPDDDVPLDLAQALSTIYDEAAYDLTIDYQQSPPPPPFDPETQLWIDHLLKEYRQMSVGQ